MHDIMTTNRVAQTLQVTFNIAGRLEPQSYKILTIQVCCQKFIIFNDQFDRLQNTATVRLHIFIPVVFSHRIFKAGRK